MQIKNRPKRITHHQDFGRVFNSNIIICSNIARRNSKLQSCLDPFCDIPSMSFWKFGTLQGSAWIETAPCISWCTLQNIFLFTTNWILMSSSDANLRTLGVVDCFLFNPRRRTSGGCSSELSVTWSTTRPGSMEEPATSYPLPWSLQGMSLWVRVSHRNMKSV